MRKIVLATMNDNKIREIKEILKDISGFLVSPKEFSIYELPEESGSSYRENALIKALYVCEKTNLPAIGEDSGLEIKFLNNEPGIYSSRYLGDISYEERMRLILDKMKNVEWEDRVAEFLCCLAIITPEDKENPIFIEERVQGYINWEIKGNFGFGYDPIFYYPPLRKTFGELSNEDKNKISHRAKAFLKAREIIKNLIEEGDHEGGCFHR